MFGYIIVIIIILYVYCIKLAHPNYKVVTYKDIKDKVKSGDLILFSGLDTLNQLYMGSYTTHIGVVYKKDTNSVPVLVESFNNFTESFYPKESKSGICTCELETRINSYRGYVMYKELDKPITQHANNDFLELIKYATKHMQYDYNVIQNEIGKMLLNTPFTNKTNCGQFTTLILIKINLLDFSHFKNRRKHHLIWTTNLTKLKKNKYLETVFIYQKYFKNINVEII